MTFRSMWVFRRGHPAFRRRLAIPEDRPLVVGRAPDCGVQLESRAVSKHHAEITVREGSVFVRDLGSRNGTFVCTATDVEGQRVEHDTPLGAEQAVRVAGFVLVPCETLSGGVGIIEESMAEWSGPGTTVTSLPPTEREADRAAVASLSLLERALAVEGERLDVLGAVLGALSALVGADDAFLLTAHEEGRFVLRAHLYEDRAFALSRRFLRQAAEGPGVRVLRLGQQDQGDADASLAEFAPGSVLVGIALPRPGDAPRAVFCAQASRLPDEQGTHELERIAALAGALVDLELARDREQRRREAAERAANRHVRTEDARGGLERLQQSLVGTNPRFRAAVDHALQAAPSGVTVLVRGASGTGKDLIARLVHEASPRADHPFVVRNCAAIPAELVESELFGHVRGAFTGASQDRPGAFQRADGGTLFLDEIGDLAPTAQAKVLRAIESGEIVPVGGSAHRVDVRLVAASHRNLMRMVADGEFRADLYYRLRVIEIEVPALSERPEDILPLAEHFLRWFAREEGREIKGLSPAAARVLAHYDWPGNIRELRNVIERAVVLDRDGVIDVDDLPLDLTDSGGEAERGAGAAAELLDLGWKEAKQRFGAVYFKRALELHDWQVGETARAAGISRRALTNLIREHGLRDG